MSRSTWRGLARRFHQRSVPLAEGSDQRGDARVAGGARQVCALLPGWHPRTRPDSEKIGRAVQNRRGEFPGRAHGRYSFSRRLASEDRRSLCMRQGFGGRDEILVDPAKLANDATMSVQMMEVSEDGSLLAYGIRRG